MKKITKSDIEFLKELQNEMLNGEHDYQANPRFWVVNQKTEIYGETLFNPDGIYFWDEEYEIGRGIKSLYEYIKEQVEDNEDYMQDLGISNIDEIIYLETADTLKIGDDIEIYYKYSFEEYKEIINNALGTDIQCCEYEEVEQIAENTLFLTKREAKEHIERNSYHYKKPFTYAMTAWRSPQVERLYKILEETDWDALEVE